MNQQPVISTRKPVGSHGRQEENARCARGRMILWLSAWARTPVLERYFQERGWKVHVAESADEARGLVRDHGPSVVILSDENNDHESGWLTAWKLLRDKPGSRVVLVGDLPTEQGKRFAKLVGACDYLPASETAVGIARLLHDLGICKN